MQALVLSPGREARLRLAYWDAWETRRPLTQPHHEAAAAVALYYRLQTEQAAELGYLPESLEGCMVVLELAVRILEALTRDE